MSMPLGIKSLFSSITNLKEGEKVLIITDDNKFEVGNYIYRYAKDLFDTTMVVMTARETHGAEPPEPVIAALNNCDVAFGATTMSLFHSKARLQASNNGRLRWIGLADYIPEMFETGGMTADFGYVAQVIDRVAPKFQGKQFKLTSPGGTNMTCSVEGREVVIDYGRAIKAGGFGSPPNAEVALGPVEGTSNGVLVIDGSIPHPLLNLIEEPITCIVKDGFITEITGGRQAEILRNILAEYNDPTVYNIAELGLGLNEKNVLNGHMLPDEGSFGNIHIGIGKNLGFGGHTNSPVHIDMVIKSVTCVIDDATIMKDGVLMV
jgi:leucyl aminopeptidase (aminopeptidase T)